nr:translation initiation factor IF-2 [Symphalangus syndactylus]
MRKEDKGSLAGLPAPTPDPSDVPIGLAGAPTAHPPLPPPWRPRPQAGAYYSQRRAGGAGAAGAAGWRAGTAEERAPHFPAPPGQARRALTGSGQPRPLAASAGLLSFALPHRAAAARVFCCRGFSWQPAKPASRRVLSWMPRPGPAPDPGRAPKPAAQESCVPRKSAKGQPLGLPANPRCVPPTRWDRSVRPERKYLSTGPLKNSAYVPWETSFGMLVLQRKTSMPSPLYQKSSNKQKITVRPN